VCWFADKMLPALRQRWPRAHFHIVGRNPSPAVRALAGEGITVTGAVPDVRPYLQHAAAVVAPLRVARGIRTRCSRPWPWAPGGGQRLRAVAATQPGQHLLVADDEAGFVRAAGAFAEKKALPMNWAAPRASLCRPPTAGPSAWRGWTASWSAAGVKA
jgi:polysaccharide biosynthesis protein PslH